MTGTIIVDPPWPYQAAKKGGNRTGYSNFEYNSLSLEQLSALPMRQLGDYLFLWTTVAFLEGSYCLVRAWNFTPVTTITWVKTTGLEKMAQLPFDSTITSPSSWLPRYGVGYWFRGCVEPIIVAKAPNVKSIKTPYLGLLCDSAKHSQKPDSIHQIVEKYYPPPWTEIFARRARDGWRVLGDQAPADNMDISLSIGAAINGI